jgi:hypothetical protein
MEYQKNGEVGIAAMKAGMHRETAGKYIGSGQLPSERDQQRDWRTRSNPFDQHWSEVETMLNEAPELESKALFEWLSERYPDQYQEGQLRTFQRHVRQWRALHGPDKEVYFPQEHRPGVRMQTDFTCMRGLGITIGAETFDHLLCHNVLTYSNWEWATICYSESLAALRRGLQAALVQLGHIPVEHWTDQSTAATHQLAAEASGQRGFNSDYLKLVEHFGIQPRTINRCKPHENGDVESSNGAIKRRIKQHLLLRGSQDFASRDAYREFVEGILHKANGRRHRRFMEELSVMRPLQVALLPEYVEQSLPVSRWSTILSDRRIYSVPSRLIGETVRVRRYEERIEVYLAGTLQVSMPRLTGKCSHAINYRHIIEWLIRKPGAFAQYRFHTDLFPSAVFRRAYDRLCEVCSPRAADLDYLRILRQAARTLESEVEAVLVEVEQRGLAPRWATLEEFWQRPKTTELPDLKPLSAQLADYDQLFSNHQVCL